MRTRKDTEDTTPIMYTFRMKENDGSVHTVYFTSDDPQSLFMLARTGYAWIEKIERVTNEVQDACDVIVYVK